MSVRSLQPIAAAVGLAVGLSGCADGCSAPPNAPAGIPDDYWPTAPVDVVAPGEPWEREETEAPGPITFNEILYGEANAWIELHNPLAIDLDLSGWTLGGGVVYTFAEGTVLAAGGLLVVASDPAAVGGALGPFSGTLSESGERLELRNNTARLIDTVHYGEDDPWPVAADGSGFSLAKIDPDTASDRAENWTVSAQLGGTPGAPNLLDPLAPPITLALVALDATWTYDLSGDPASDWALPDYDDSAWASGQATFFAGASEEDVAATARATADNYYALYLGESDGTNLRWIGEDADGDWTTVESFGAVVTSRDRLYVAAWEATGDSGSPQMVIAEVELAGGLVGTSALGFEWILGPVDALPGVLPPALAPPASQLTLLIDAADAGAAWLPPLVELPPTAEPWGGTVSPSFDSETKFLWADTFDASSVTNTENTFALFRSTEALLAARGGTELSGFGTTAIFRTTFSFDADPAAAQLSVAYLVDDGAVFYLNGVEVLRDNLPAGALDPTTYATAVVGDAALRYADLPADALVRGTNVLSVALHQAEPNDPDLTFACALTAEIWPETATRSVVFNEVAPASEAPFWVEWHDVRPDGAEPEGFVLASSGGGERVFPAGTIVPGELQAYDIDFSVEAGDVLFLYSADRAALLDAVRVQERLRGRAREAGAWRFPSEATQGAPNVLETTDDVVIHEIQYHHAPLSREGEPVVSQDEEWIELYNRGEGAVDLGGWQLVDAVAYTFPEGTILEPDAYVVVAEDASAFAAAHPDVPALGDFAGRLGNGSERILLLDARGNPADEVRYFDGGRWPEAADGGGSTLELRDPFADNGSAEVWAASDEGSRSQWVSVRYRGVATPSVVGPDGVWNELVLGLLDAGEVLIDDLSVVEDPDGVAAEAIYDGAFDDDGASWRLLGNHRHSEVVPDPDDASNHVLRLVATGATGHMHNHAETTLLRPLAERAYEVSYRARWISGSNQVNTRLYFNRLPKTTRIAQPDASGTPGAPNTASVDNAGPTFHDLRQDVAVPAPAEPVWVSVSVADPDGVADVTLWSSVAGAPFAAIAMAEAEPGRWEASLNGEPAGTIVQLYVEAEDDRGARATFPAAGPDSRALYRVDDGEAATNGLHNFRILLTAADSDWLHDDVNLMSDDLVGATIVYNESRVFYDVGVRAKGSERGRPEVARLGYGVAFGADQPFRGRHESVLVDRSEGVGYGQREVLLNLVMTHAGSLSGEYNDLIQALTPLPEHTGPAELQLDRFTSLMLDAQFVDGAEGQLFEYELIYYPLTTDDGTPRGQKLPQPDSVIGTPVTDLGPDPEAWRWNFLIDNNEREDDYTGIQALGQAFALTGPDFLAEADRVLDVEAWLRAFAFATLNGAVDNYGGDGSQHNARFYVRPADQKVLYFPHDLDFYGSSEMAVVGNGDLLRLIEDPVNLRSYYGHLADIIERAYNPVYLAPWCDQIGALTNQDFAGHCQFVDDRADWVMRRAPDAVLALFPRRAFAVTTEGGADFSVSTANVVLEGEAWVDVRQIALDGALTPLPVTWVDEGTWQVTVSLAPGANPLTLVATDLRGEEVGRDALVVTSEP